VLGAHIGTTVTAVIASLGTSAEARRTALANVGFNLFNAALGVAFAWLLVPLLEQTASSVVHQTANAHTAMMVIATVILLPVVRPLTGLIRRLAWPSAPVLPASHLDPRLLSQPEAALHATMRELGRCTLLIEQSFQHVIDSMEGGANHRAWRAVRHNEEAIDEIRASVRAYLGRLARRKPAPQHGLLAQALNRFVVELERIGDHVDHLREFVTETTLSDFEASTRNELLQLARRTFQVVELVGQTFASDQPDLDACSWQVLEARNRYRAEVAQVKQAVSERLGSREVLPELALAFSEIVTAFDRIVRHCAVIAQERRLAA
jgi:phosphate:Na+ symporter